MTSPVTEKAIKKNVWQMPESSKYLQRNLVLDNGHLLDQVLQKKCYSAEKSPQGAWDHIADEMLLEFAESRHPIFRATTPLSRCILKSKGHGKLSIHFTADYPTLETVFPHHNFLPISSVSTEQWRLFVKNLKLIKMDQGNLMY